ncbi:outer membrane beta-barrel protein [Desulfovermiculus halophilus]|jgi:hypothetical protein|uniref:outer membrane beta-barrel protein n=1 Tax=Desulfovermiculus halophilus TaxID=339722 RepID=UPI000486B166|nr:outer membrane beta-barrel protein [Desulfovermiculus halophilus]
MRAFVIFVLIALFPAFCWAAQDSGHLAKKNSVAIKPGYHFYPDSDFFDFWGNDADDLSGFMFELAYERELNDYLGLEIGLGYFSSKEKYHNVLFLGDSADLDIQNTYVSPTLKGYLPLCDYVYLYAGIGPDIYYTYADFDYDSAVLSYSNDNDEFSLGAHVQGGMEVYLFTEPGAGLYDWPVGLFVEYRYSWVDVEDLDQPVVSDVNKSLDTNYGENDLDVGGSQVMMGLRWHF